MEITFRQGPIVCAGIQKCLLGLCGWWLVCVSAMGQGGAMSVRWQVSAADEEVWRRDPLPLRYADSLAFVRRLERWRADLQGEGWLEVSCDSLRRRGDTTVVWLHIGPRYRWAHVDVQGLEGLLLRGGSQPVRWAQGPVRLSEYARVGRRIVREAAQHGYPFAAVWLDSVRVREGKVAARLRYRAGTLVRFDTLRMVGADTLLRSLWLSRWLGIRKGQPFNQLRIAEAQRRLKALPFVRLTSPVEPVFEYERAFVQVALAPRRANQLDGIVGLLPNSADNRRLALTGQFDLHLHNLFGTAKRLQVRWQRLTPGAQSLHLEGEVPAVFRTRVDVLARLQLLREDTSFQNVHRRLMIRYPVIGGGHIALLGEWFGTTVYDPRRFAGTKTLPDISTHQVVSYGLNFVRSALDEPERPRKGWQVELEGQAGNKSLSPLRQVPDSLYRQVPLQSVQVQARIDVQYFQPLGRRSTLWYRQRSGTLWAESLFVNDLFRLGGFNFLRGFNENAFFASAYAVQSAEYRFYYEEDAFVFGFVEQAWLDNRIAGQREWPFSVGFGLRFATKGGVFQMAYAMGRSEAQPFEVRYAKLHFGLISRF